VQSLPVEGVVSYDADGKPATYRERQFSQHDAELLREYKKDFLAKHGYKERLWCQRCEDAGEHSGVRAFVTEQRIGMTCRCSNRVYNGMTY
jgi:hypothetical protein